MIGRRESTSPPICGQPTVFSVRNSPRRKKRHVGLGQHHSACPYQFEGWKHIAVAVFKCKGLLCCLSLTECTVNAVLINAVSTCPSLRGHIVKKKASSEAYQRPPRGRPVHLLQPPLVLHKDLALWHYVMGNPGFCVLCAPTWDAVS